VEKKSAKSCLKTSRMSSPVVRADM